MPQPPLTRADLERLDAEDPLTEVRDRFLLPEGVLYFDGNSLGPLTREASRRFRQAEQQWRDDLVASWNLHDWIDLPRSVGAKIAPLVGAEPEDVVVCDSVSVNLFKLMAAALSHASRLDARRSRIAVQADHFSTDLYIADGLGDLLGDPDRIVRLDATAIERLLRDPRDILDPDVAVVSLGHIDFRTGRLFDMAGLTRAIHDAGALALWDLSHSAGALPVDLAGCEVDLAVGCGYKFLNGGPGAPSFLYIAPHLQEHLATPLPGWLGHADPFAFAERYEPAPGVQRFVCGTPPILSLQALDAALDIWQGIDLSQVRQKSLALGDAFLRLASERLSELGIDTASPGRAEERGSQVSLRHKDGHAIMQALIHRRVVGDFRAPDLLRFGLCPLFLRHADVWDAVDVLRDIVVTGFYKQEPYQRRARVT